MALGTTLPAWPAIVFTYLETRKLHHPDFDLPTHMASLGFSEEAHQ